MLPDERFNGVHVGSEYVPSYDVLIKNDKDSKSSLASGILPAVDGGHYFVEQQDLKVMEQSGIKELCRLMGKESPNEFEEKVLSSARIFLKNAFASSNTEKLIFAVVSLESLMLRNQTESIVQNVSERVAFFLTNEISDRKDCIKIIKDAYSMRSAYMHHGRTSDDKEAIMEFLMVVFTTICAILERLDEFKKKDEFLDYLDDLKLS